ncbi:MAG: HNH endonuclease [Rhodobacteraceae bacterium]|nr:MAG: HNH endonuclease [Paracoccaceae bacterium]
MTANKFRAALDRRFQSASSQGEDRLILESRELHRKTGGYPGPNHRMPVCCEVMRSAMKSGDWIVQAPPKGDGATLKISYALPR